MVLWFEVFFSQLQKNQNIFPSLDYEEKKEDGKK